MKITRLELFAPNIEAQADFYTKKLDLPVQRDSADQITIQAGATELVFRKAEASWNKGVYHLALNVPEKLIDQVHAWLSDRTTLIPNKDWQEVFHFKAWNAHAIYCYDAAGNIVELVARHDLTESNDFAGAGSGHILCISELGFSVENILPFRERLIKGLGLKPHQDTISRDFYALGDNHGMLLVAAKGREWYPFTGKLAAFVPFKLWVEEAGRAYTIHAHYSSKLFQKPTEEVDILPVK
jgi:catechol-2,3-dioxygenase